MGATIDISPAARAVYINTIPMSPSAPAAVPKAMSAVDADDAPASATAMMRSGTPISWDHAVTLQADVERVARPPAKSAKP